MLSFVGGVGANALLFNISVLVYLLVVSEISKLDSEKSIVSAAQKAEDRLIMNSKKNKTWLTFSKTYGVKNARQLSNRYNNAAFSLKEEKATFQR